MLHKRLDHHTPIDGYLALKVSSGVRTQARRQPDKIAIEDRDRRISYGELVQRMNQIGNLAKNRWSIKRGDIVALISPNRFEYLEIVLGLSDIGATVATLNPRLTRQELSDVIEDCSPRHIIIDPMLEDARVAALSAGTSITILDALYEENLLQSPADFTLENDPETSDFSICYTSGTTGKPKGVLLSHRSRSLTCMAMALEYGCFGQTDRFLMLVPLCHGAGFAFALASISFGGTCVLFHDQNTDALLDRLCEGDISGVFMVPTHFSRIGGIPAERLNSVRAQHKLKTIISNAAALAQMLREQTIKIFGPGLLNETYGSTEAGIVTNIPPGHIIAKPGSVGTPFLNTEIEIRNEDGEICAPGEMGELFSRAPYTFSGYLNRPEATAETIQDGWVSVKDLAVTDEDGFITICGRMKDMVVSGGVNIYPAEVEAVLEKLPGVTEAAVVGLPDSEWGEKLHAFIAGNEADMLSGEEMLLACREALSGHKIPGGISFVEELPRDASGKILKRKLREVGAN